MSRGKGEAEKSCGWLVLNKYFFIKNYAPEFHNYLCLTGIIISNNIYEVKKYGEVGMKTLMQSCAVIIMLAGCSGIEPEHIIDCTAVVEPYLLKTDWLTNKETGMTYVPCSLRIVPISYSAAAPAPAGGYRTTLRINYEIRLGDSNGSLIYSIPVNSRTNYKNLYLRVPDGNNPASAFVGLSNAGSITAAGTDYIVYDAGVNLHLLMPFTNVDTVLRPTNLSNHVNPVYSALKTAYTADTNRINLHVLPWTNTQVLSNNIFETSNLIRVSVYLYFSPRFVENYSYKYDTTDDTGWQLKQICLDYYIAQPVVPQAIMPTSEINTLQDVFIDRIIGYNRYLKNNINIYDTGQTIYEVIFDIETINSGFNFNIYYPYNRKPLAYINGDIIR